tara:strand:- start:110004 stop:113453 length:3450 start_codon:yes stop_codon:yes gene_type:complete
MKKFTIGAIFCAIMVCSFGTYAQSLVRPIQNELTQLVENNELLTEDLQWEITSEHVSSSSNIQHIYFTQVLNDLKIYGTESSIHLFSNGDVLKANTRFIKNVASLGSRSSTPSLTAEQAVVAAASHLNYSITETLSVVSRKNNASKETLLSNGGISLSPIPAKLMYQLSNNNELVLVWDVSIEEAAQQNWWNVRVDATTGEIVDKNNWMVSCSFEHDHSVHEEILDYNANLFDIPNYNELVAASEAGCSECYEVIAAPLESPYYGPRTIEMSPANLTASPFGWHDTDGTAGAEFTTTRGNNVNAYEDGDNPGFQPDGGATLDFTGFPFSQTYSNANQYESAAITNLFYWNNTFHDVLYQYGFDEAGGNFQENNYGNGGAGSDSVNAEAQDGSGSCNANFGTPNDGTNPRMQMYICNDKDGDFDNLVIVHEYGHGVSNRLTGGPSNTGCLSNQEQMGEGWSDFYGVLMTIEAGDTGTDARAVGTYLFGQGAGGGGIRPFPYSTDLTVNPQTYDDIKTAAVPHGVGSVWATTMWEITWALIDEHGFDSDFYTFTGDVNQDAGNIQAWAIVTEAMKLQPCSPGFIDGRDAIFAADQAIYGGANECILWDAFAKRGLGVSASQGSSASRADGVEAFDTPSGMAMFTAPNDVCASSDVLTGLGGGSPNGGVYSGPGVTDDGNGSTYSFDPVTAGVGVHTIMYEVMAGTCSVASSATDDIEVIAIPAGPTTNGETGFCVGDDVTVTATLNDPTNVIRWYDSLTGGTFLSEGTSYTFTPTGSTTVYAQELPPGPLSQLVISEITLETPDQFEIQNVGVATDYTGYTVAVSDDPYPDINAINSVTQSLGNMAANSVVYYDDQSGSPVYWGSNLFWDENGTGWIIIIDDAGNVVDSLFWNFSAAEIANLNVTINGFNVTAADLDWTGDGATFSVSCNDSFRRVGETNTAADWSGTCEPSDYGVPNSEIALDGGECLGERTATEVTVEDEAPVLTCPADLIETVEPGEQFTIPDYTGMASVTDNCSPLPAIVQDPAVGTMVGVGVTTITMTATDLAGNEGTCTFDLTVENILGIEDQTLVNGITLYPNPTNGNLTLRNSSSIALQEMTITDVNGRIIQSHDMSNTQTETNFSVDTLSEGIYFVKIISEKGSVVKRIIKE